MPSFSVDAQHPERGSLLFAAAKQGLLGVVRTLLEDFFATPDLRHPVTNETPLYVAARNGHTEVYGLLVKHGADPFLPVKQTQSTMRSQHQNRSVGLGPTQHTYNLQAASAVASYSYFTEEKAPYLVHHVEREYARLLSLQLASLQISSPPPVGSTQTQTTGQLYGAAATQAGLSLTRPETQSQTTATTTYSSINIQRPVEQAARGQQAASTASAFAPVIMGADGCFRPNPAWEQQNMAQVEVPPVVVHDPQVQATPLVQQGSQAVQRAPQPQEVGREQVQERALVAQQSLLSSSGIMVGSSSPSPVRGHNRSRRVRLAVSNSFHSRRKKAKRAQNAAAGELKRNSKAQSEEPSPVLPPLSLETEGLESEGEGCSRELYNRYKERTPELGAEQSSLHLLAVKRLGETDAAMAKRYLEFVPPFRRHSESSSCTRKRASSSSASAVRATRPSSAGPRGGTRTGTTLRTTSLSLSSSEASSSNDRSTSLRLRSGSEFDGSTVTPVNSSGSAVSGSASSHSQQESPSFPDPPSRTSSVTTDANTTPPAMSAASAGASSIPTDHRNAGGAPDVTFTVAQPTQQMTQVSHAELMQQSASAGSLFQQLGDIFSGLAADMYQAATSRLAPDTGGTPQVPLDGRSDMEQETQSTRSNVIRI
ncbi:unnamed protein product [Amoebophrya sp. A25]|nr:unnamed protein product [Amoebophrya sp. A25]|eukprot:GSA25T00018313001.1